MSTLTNAGEKAAETVIRETIERQHRQRITTEVCSREWSEQPEGSRQLVSRGNAQLRIREPEREQTLASGYQPDRKYRAAIQRCFMQLSDGISQCDQLRGYLFEQEVLSDMEFHMLNDAEQRCGRGYHNQQLLRLVISKTERDAETFVGVLDSKLQEKELAGAIRDALTERAGVPALARPAVSPLAVCRHEGGGVQRHAGVDGANRAIRSLSADQTSHSSKIQYKTEIAELKSQVQNLKVDLQNAADKINSLSQDLQLVNFENKTLKRCNQELENKLSVSSSTSIEYSHSNSTSTNRLEIAEDSKADVTASSPAKDKGLRMEDDSYRKSKDLGQLCVSSWEKVHGVEVGRCDRLCYFNGKLYVPNAKDSIHVCNLDLEETDKLDCSVVKSPRSVHPLSGTGGDLILAADSGLYVVDGAFNVRDKIREGNFQDVHCDGGICAALEKNSPKYKIVLIAATPGAAYAAYEEQHQFEHSGHATSVHVSAGRVLVTDTDQVTEYSPRGLPLLTYGRGAGAAGGGDGPLRMPRVCMTDGSGRVLVADEWNNRLRVLLAGRGGVVPEVGVKKPRDALLIGDMLYVLSGFGLHNYNITSFKIKWV